MELYIDIEREGLREGLMDEKGKNVGIIVFIYCNYTYHVHNYDDILLCSVAIIYFWQQ